MYAFTHIANVEIAFNITCFKMSVSCSHNKISASAACLLSLVFYRWLSHCQGYVIVNSVSWSVTNEVEEEMDSSSTEDALPETLEDTISMWKQSYPASAYKEVREAKARPEPGASKKISSPSRMFSYRRKGSAATEKFLLSGDAFQHRLAKNARAIAHQSKWGFLVTLPAQKMDVPIGNILLTSDGPTKNSTGVPFCYVPANASFISDLLENPGASLTYADLDGEIIRKSSTEPEVPQCTSLTLKGQMKTVSSEEIDFARKALYSRHSLMMKWSQNKEWLLMRMNTEHIILTNCYGAAVNISLEDYYMANPI
uniref:Cellular repressor of E1A stimulateds 2 n=1 Tax=Leptobrachium leishanense TaxID=445787 RepID=A0A8C5MBK3_9ANUR